MKYSSLPSQGDEEDKDNDVPEPPLPFVAPTCPERYIFLLSMMGFFMIVAALGLHDNQATQALRGYSMNQTDLGVDPCSFWEGDCSQDDLSGDDLAALEAFLDDPSGNLAYDEVVEQFSEHIDEGNTFLDEEEEQQQQQQEDDVDGVIELDDLAPMEVLYDPPRNDNPSNTSEPDSELFPDDFLEIQEEATVSRIEDEENFGN